MFEKVLISALESGARIKHDIHSRLDCTPSVRFDELNYYRGYCLFIYRASDNKIPGDSSKADQTHRQKVPQPNYFCFFLVHLKFNVR